MRSLTALSEQQPPSAVAIGKFDGIHLGHQELLRRVRSYATAQGVASVAFTFTENPLHTIRPEVCPRALMSPERRIAGLTALGVETVVMIDFDRAFSELSPEAYAADILVGQLNAQHLVVGEDFRFGHRAEGDVARLRALGEQLGFTVETVPEVTDPEGNRVSSTQIRSTLTAGNVDEAACMLDGPVLLIGEVVHGAARGRELGFPTANLGGVLDGFTPADGVYAGWATHRGIRYQAAISVGTNPTFEDGEVAQVEVFLLDASLDLYGDQLEVHFVKRLRGMVAYTTAEALIEQMHQDVRDTREVLATAQESGTGTETH